MTNSLYIFVDESGLPSQGELYAVAACWCVSYSTVEWRVLKPTVDRLTHIAEDLYHGSGQFGELKGARLGPDILDSLMPNLGDLSFEDKTLETSTVPWDLTYPVRFTSVRFHTDLALEVLGGALNAQPDGPEALQTLGLISILDPLLHEGMVSRRGYSRVKIILDSETWIGPARTLDGLLDGVTAAPDAVTFETHDSKKAMGLQIADLGAHCWGRHARFGDCADAVEHLEHLRLSPT